MAAGDKAAHVEMSTISTLILRRIIKEHLPAVLTTGVARHGKPTPQDINLINQINDLATTKTGEAQMKYPSSLYPPPPLPLPPPP